MDYLHNKNCIRTYSGIYMNVFEPTEDMINIKDIAHALSNICRWGGHIPKFYSVAQHSILCAAMSFGDKLEALLHDASEAYLMDIPRPIKRGLSNYKELEDNLMSIIAKKFGINFPFSYETKVADDDMLEWEWENLILNKGNLEKDYWEPEKAKKLFLKTFYEYNNK